MVSKHRDCADCDAGIEGTCPGHIEASGIVCCTCYETNYCKPRSLELQAGQRGLDDERYVLLMILAGSKGELDWLELRQLQRKPRLRLIRAMNWLMRHGFAARRLVPQGNRFKSKFSVIRHFDAGSEPKQVWRLYRRANSRLEAHCNHGVGHSLGIHGCDRCCQARNFPGEVLALDDYIKHQAWHGESGDNPGRYGW